MDRKNDTYNTISKNTTAILFKEKGSKFYGYAFHITSEEEVKPIIEILRQTYPTANHVCHAWQLGHERIRFRANDDGEPNNSAGMPIYGQIQSFEVTNILVAVVRIFGGTKLGVGGLIQAYKTTAQMTLEASKIVEKVIEEAFSLRFGYPQMDIVMRIIKQYGLKVMSQKLEMDCELVISVRQKLSDEIFQLFSRLHLVQIKKIQP